MLDGLGRPEQYVKRAKSLGLEALALTDHGVVSALPEHYLACREAGVGAVLGCEMYYLPQLLKGTKKRPDYNHLIVLARGEWGYRVLSELVTESHRNYYYKPAIDREILLGLGDDLLHLTILSGCLAGPLARAAKVGEDYLAEEMEWWRRWVPHFYVELQHHGTADDRIVNKRLIKEARRQKVPLVATSDSHFVECHQSDLHDTLLAIQTGSSHDDPDRFRFDGEGYWLQSRKELLAQFQGYPMKILKEAVSNTSVIAEACIAKIPEWETRTWHVPDIPDIPKPLREVIRIVKEALRDKGLRGEYIERTKQELAIIKELNVAGFLLVAADAVAQAKERGIYVGPGRGSVCGSLVAFLLGIHGVDPVRYQLRFDRFLNPERPRMPDIDIDFAQKRREEMFAYVRDKYGEENVVGVATFPTMRSKRAFKTLAKIHGLSFEEANDISKEFPDDEDEDLEDYIPRAVLEKYPTMAEQLQELIGVRASFGTHPAGVIIASPSYELTSKIPLMWLPTPQKYVAQYDLASFEMMGLLKQDFLGLRTLETITECMRLVEEATGETIDPSAWIPDEEDWDAEVWKMLGLGNTGGVFQCEGHSSTEGCMEMKPSSFSDLITLLALYRKGPKQAGMTKAYLKNRKAKKVDYIHPLLEPILGPTWGTMCFQEQVMDIGEKVAGFGPGDSDDLLRAVAKKKHDLMEKVHPKFIEGCCDNGLEEEQADKLWEQIKDQAEYQFNKAHSTGYAYLAYITASLKVRFPLEFYCALLRTVEGKDKPSKERRLKYLREAAATGIKIVPPCVNRSDAYATPDREANAIRFGLTDISGIGAAMAKRILTNRGDGYWSDSVVEDVINNSKAFAALKDSGGLMDLGIRPNIAKAEELLNWSLVDRMKKWREKYQDRFRPPEIVYGEIVMNRKSKTKQGKPFVTWTVRWDHVQSWQVRIWSEAEMHHALRRGSIVRITGRYQEKYRSISVGSPDDIKVIKEAK